MSNVLQHQSIKPLCPGSMVQLTGCMRHMCVCRGGRHQQLPCSSGRDLSADSTHAFHSVLQEAELAEYGGLYEHHGCHSHYAGAGCTGPPSKTHAFAGLSYCLCYCKRHLAVHPEDHVRAC